MTGDHYTPKISTPSKSSSQSEINLSPKIAKVKSGGR